MDCVNDETKLIRLPGLFRRFELERVITVGVEFRIESAGNDCDGSEFFAVYRREAVRPLSDVVAPIAPPPDKPSPKAEASIFDAPASIHAPKPRKRKGPFPRQSWSEDLDKQLLALGASGVRTHEIARILRRSEGAVSGRLSRLRRLGRDA